MNDTDARHLDTVTIHQDLLRGHHPEGRSSPELNRDTEQETPEIALDAKELAPSIPRFLLFYFHLGQYLFVLADDEGIVDVAMCVQASEYAESLFVPSFHREVARTLGKEPEGVQ